jgi:adenosylcobinamide kinase / adenosylcobinamide-phosphate guanylyltransferase
MLTLLTGPAASGKSTLAVRLAGSWDGPVTVIATAEAGDEEMAARIARHRAERPADWSVVEEPVALWEAVTTAQEDACLIVDCLTLWVANLQGAGQPPEAIVAAAVEAAEAAGAREAPAIVVTNEVGWGIVPANAMARTYRDLLGRVNRAFADVADRTLLVVAGRALPLAEEPSL